jgi:hypothetical protein
MTTNAGPKYRERLWASPWVFIATALVIPASILVFLPINRVAGIVVAVVLYAAILGLLAIGSPTIQVTETALVAGRAQVPLHFVGSVTAFRDDEASLQRGQKLDARAWLLIRGWVSPIVRVEIIDPDDPTPYWIVSSRTPEALAGAIEGAKAKA